VLSFYLISISGEPNFGDRHEHRGGGDALYGRDVLQRPLRRKRLLGTAQRGKEIEATPRKQKL
jgi:hypothetical protein